MNETEKEIRADLIKQINKRVSDKVIEKSNANLLIKLIDKADSLEEAISIAELGTMYKSTGFHFDVRLEKSSDTIHYLKKNDGLSFSDGSAPNKLIIGENYSALQNLLIQYRGKVDMIYIDPPYGKDSMGEHAKTNYENAITRDNLLSSLYPRLVLAKQLLTRSGSIWCSINDQNQAYVKCLFDEVFEERNMIACFPKKGSGGKQDSTHFAVIHEYVLCYAKDKNDYKAGEIQTKKEYKYWSDKHQCKYNLQLLRKWGDNAARDDRPNLFYPLYFNEKSGSLSLEKTDCDDIEILPMLSDTEEGRWRWEKSTMRSNLQDGRVTVIKKKGECIAYEMILESEEDNSKLYNTWIDDVDNRTGKVMLKNIMGKDLFSYPKPVDLMRQLIQMATPNKDALVLDFYAGSGTTGHAVLDLNQQDGGSRKFIICTLNEVTKTTPSGIAYDCTSKRLKRIMTGSCYDGSSSFAWIRDNRPYGGSLEVTEIAEIAAFAGMKGQTPFDVIDEKLYGLDMFDNIRDKIKWVCTNFRNTQKLLEGEN